MRILEACKAIEEARDGAILVTTMGSMYVFDAMGVSAGRMSSVPLMGGASGLGLGLALAHPQRTVIVLDGDASLLMQLGSLATVAGQQPRRFAHFVVHNGSQFTGGVNLKLACEDAVDFCGMARAAGYRHVVRVDSVATLQEVVAEMHSVEGPAFYELCVEPEAPRFGAENPQTEMPDRQFSRIGEEAVALAAWLQER